MSEVNSPDLNEDIQDEIDDAEVITVPIDDTLSISGEAADAKAVGDALAQKADRSELPIAIKVNGQEADNQGLILVSAEEIAMSDEDETTVAEAIAAAAGKTADEILMEEDGETTIAEAIAGLQEADTELTAAEIHAIVAAAFS